MSLIIRVVVLLAGALVAPWCAATAIMQPSPASAAAAGASSPVELRCTRPVAPPWKPKPPAASAVAGNVVVNVTCEAAAPAASSSGTPTPPVKPPVQASGPKGADPASSAASGGAKPASFVRDAVVILAASGALALMAAGVTLVLRSLARRDVRDLKPEHASAPYDDGFHFRRHWGSFGGESTGWNISPRMTQLLAGALLAMAGTWLLLRILDIAR
jgi:hypothetical protein